MNPEIWALVRKSELENLLTEQAGSQGLTYRGFRDAAEALTREEPDGGMVIAIEATEKFANYMTIIKRFQKNFLSFDLILFGKEKTDDITDYEKDVGVDLYFPLPVDREDFLVRVTNLVALRKLKSSANIIGRSPGFNSVLETVMQVAPTEVPVLIEGESGSGKEVLARAIHISSRRSEKRFEAVNCGALAEGVLESELFGHEKGSFTGAVSRRQGLFERADGGTLLLDEVGEMSLKMQVRLLRVIETGEFLRVGGTQSVHADVRLIAATNKELETAVEREGFRKDLYYRLKVVQIRVPPLRTRKQDIPLMARYFLRRATARHRKKVRGIDRGGMQLLTNYPWPGNVRELSNVIDNIVVLSRESIIKVEEIEKRLKERMQTQVLPDLPVHVQRSREEVERDLILNSLLSLNNDVKEMLRILRGEDRRAGSRWGRFVEVKEAPAEEPRDLNSIEREAIREALIANGGNRRKTAKLLGISERTLYRRLKEYNLN